MISHTDNKTYICIIYLTITLISASSILLTVWEIYTVPFTCTLGKMYCAITCIVGPHDDVISMWIQVCMWYLIRWLNKISQVVTILVWLIETTSRQGQFHGLQMSSTKSTNVVQMYEDVVDRFA